MAVRWRTETGAIGISFRLLAEIDGVRCMVRPDIRVAGHWVGVVYFEARHAKRRWHSEELAKAWCEVTAKAGTPPPD